MRTFTEESLAALRQRIAPVDAAIAARTQALYDNKTKPRSSLGRLEALACRIAAARGEPSPRVRDKAVVVLAADHGVAEAGVSAYPQEVTAQMVLNFARGGAAINVLARHAGARLVVADFGVKVPLAGPADGVRDCRVGPGTRNMLVEAAMTREQALSAIGHGAAIAEELAEAGVGLIAIGEMGIGNTTSASALTAALTGTAARLVTGRGTGVDDAGYERKVAAVQAALERHRDAVADPLAALACVGGFELAGLVGVTLAASARRVPVVLDGFIASAAALCATRIAPTACGYLIASHASVEQGHRVVLEALGLEPLLSLGLRLGEASGAALALPLLDASLRILAEMATFDAAGVSDSGR